MDKIPLSILFIVNASERIDSLNPTSPPPCQLYNLGKYWSPKARHRIPALLDRKTSSITTSITSRQNIRKALIALGIEPRVQESHGWAP